VPIAFVMARHRSRTRPPRLHDSIPVVACCAMFALVLEVLQLGLPRRYPEISDVLTAGLGGVLGSSAWRWFMHLGTTPPVLPTTASGPGEPPGRARIASLDWSADGAPEGEPIAPASS
jgi:hypothetical protein